MNSRLSELELSNSELNFQNSEISKLGNFSNSNFQTRTFKLELNPELSNSRLSNSRHLRELNFSKIGTFANSELSNSRHFRTRTFEFELGLSRLGSFPRGTSKLLELEKKKKKLETFELSNFPNSNFRTPAFELELPNSSFDGIRTRTFELELFEDSKFRT